MTLTLFELRPDPPPLTERQTWIYGLIVAAGHEGITADELGAQMHEQHGKHPAGDRCVFCGSDGLRALRERAIAERCVKRGRSAWVAVDAPAAPSSQLSELPGTTWEDMFQMPEASPERPSGAPLQGKPYPGHLIRCPSCGHLRFDWMGWDYGACERRSCGFEWRPSA